MRLRKSGGSPLVETFGRLAMPAWQRFKTGAAYLAEPMVDPERVLRRWEDNGDSEAFALQNGLNLLAAIGVAVSAAGVVVSSAPTAPFATLAGVAVEGALMYGVYRTFMLSDVVQMAARQNIVERELDKPEEEQNFPAIVRGIVRFRSSFDAVAGVKPSRFHPLRPATRRVNFPDSVKSTQRKIAGWING